MKKVMIVDDEIMVRVGMKAIIDWSEYGYIVVAECSNGVEALTAIERDEPDLIFTDLKMDEMDGFALMNICKQRFPDIRFIILSNYNDFDNAKKAIQLGAIDYIFKLTITSEDLAKALQNADEHLIRRQEKTNRLLQKNITAIKGHLIKVVAEGSYNNEQSMMHDLQEVCPKNDFTVPYCVLQVSIDVVKDRAQKPVAELQLLKYGVENLLGEVLNLEHSAEVYNYFLNDLLVIMNTGQFTNYQQLESYMLQKFSVMKEYVKRYCALSITAALSGIYSGIQQVRIAVEETNSVLAYRISSENGRLYTQSISQREEICAVKRYIHHHLQDSLSLEVVAKEINMNKSYFSHLFKDEMNISFTDYITQMRISKACELLKNPKLKINEVAMSVGINNINYFSVLFKKEVGMPPHAYREQLQLSL